MSTSQAFRVALHIPVTDPASAGRSVVITTPGEDYETDFLLAGGVPEAPIDGLLYGRIDETWASIGTLSASQILTLLKTVDGAGSGLDADFLDGQNSSAFATTAYVDASVGTIDCGEF